jgi:hypothetical protein
MQTLIWVFTIAALSATANPAPRVATDDIGQLLQRAGNADSEDLRLDLLRQLRRRGGLDERLQTDLDRLIREIERWNNDPLDYFDARCRGRGLRFRNRPNSPLYPLTYLYRGRMVTWYALNRGPSGRRQLKKTSLDAREFFEKAAAAFPENRITRMYLGS